MNKLVVPFHNTGETLPTVYQQVIHKSRYARWNEIAGRRETWFETTARYCLFMKDHIKRKYDFNLGEIHDTKTVLGRAFQAIYRLDVMPSMRCLMTAGPALEREHMC